MVSARTAVMPTALTIRVISRNTASAIPTYFSLFDLSFTDLYICSTIFSRCPITLPSSYFYGNLKPVSSMMAILSFR